MVRKEWSFGLEEVLMQVKNIEEKENLQCIKADAIVHSQAK